MKQTIIFIVLVVIILAIVGCVLYTSWQNKRNVNRNEWDVFNFIKNNPDRAALYLTKNNNVLAKSSAHQIMPVAHAVNITIAIEYANQVAKGYIDKNQLVSLNELKLYDIPNTDGGAHESWTERFRNRNQNTIHKDKVQLHDVVKGMIQLNSHANTAFLLDVLDLNQINRNLPTLGLHEHEEIYYFTSAFLLPAYLNIEESLSKGKLTQKLRQMPMQDFRAYCGIIHGLLKQRSADRLMERTIQTNINDVEVQKIIASRLPGATVEEYARLINNIHTGKGFEENSLILLKDVLERQPSKQDNQWSYFGGQGGSTTFTNNHIVYGTTVHEGDSFVLSVFMNDLKNTESTWIHKEIGTFILKSLTDHTFQDEVVSRLS